MTTFAPWIVGLAPIVLLLVGLVPSAQADRSPLGMVRAARVAAACALAAAVAAVAFYFSAGLGGPAATAFVGAGGIGISIYVDALSAVMALLVAFVGLIVVAYSRNYLDGDAGQGHFFKWLCLTLAAVLTLIISGNLLQFVLAWIATSLCLHQLLVFYAERRNAQLAARKKFLTSRLGDVCLIVAMALIFSLFGTLDFATVFAEAEALRGEPMPATVHWIAVLVVAGALLKSAQFPFHGWLTEVMETPTPVSALLHAGIINAGGFLVLRFSDVVALSLPALEILAVVGGVTALFGAVVMLTQTSVKVSLAWSTVAQMGFMMLQCGLGAFSAALLHIVAHSLYKAHAFLSSGSVIDLARASWVPSPGGKPHPARLALALAGAVAVTWAVSTLFQATFQDKPGVFVLGAVLAMGVTHLVANAIDERPSAFVIGRGVALAAGVAVLYFALQAGAGALLANAVPETQALRGVVDLILVAVVILGFGAVTVLQITMARRAGDPGWQRLYVHLFNGLYVNAYSNRLVQRLWPLGATPAAKGAE